MKLTFILSLAAFGSAFVILDEQVADELTFEHKKPTSIFDSLPLKEQTLYETDAILDNAIDRASEESQSRFQCLKSMTAFDAQSWLDTIIETEAVDLVDEEEDHPPRRPHHPPKRGHRGRHGHAFNLTVYELIAKSKHTTKLAKLINDDKELVEILNSTKANYTIFVPTDKAFEKIPKHGKHPPKEFIKKALLYHVAEGAYPAGRVLASHTIPTLLKEKSLAVGSAPQRLRVSIGLGGLHINFFSRVIAVNIVSDFHMQLASLLT
jgi:uncharacterized surface protein with fasciclin (FAS1) repeats